jgi:hypothetical protein
MLGNADVPLIIDVFMVLDTGALGAPADQPASTRPSHRHKGCCGRSAIN